MILIAVNRWELWDRFHSWMRESDRSKELNKSLLNALSAGIFFIAHLVEFGPLEGELVGSIPQ